MDGDELAGVGGAETTAVGCVVLLQPASRSSAVTAVGAATKRTASAEDVAWRKCTKPG
jgi:hypothetical protein